MPERVWAAPTAADVNARLLAARRAAQDLKDYIDSERIGRSLLGGK